MIMIAMVVMTAIWAKLRIIHKCFSALSQTVLKTVKFQADSLQMNSWNRAFLLAVKSPFYSCVLTCGGQMIQGCVAAAVLQAEWNDFRQGGHREPQKALRQDTTSAAVRTHI